MNEEEKKEWKKVKKLVVIVVAISLFLIFISGFASAVPLTLDRTKYYFNGTHYYTDGIDINDISINGTSIRTNASIPYNGYGWDNSLGCLDSAIYDNTQKTIGDYSIRLNGSCSLTIKLINIEGNFSGIIGVKWYDNGEDSAPGVNGFYLGSPNAQDKSAFGVRNAAPCDINHYCYNFDGSWFVSSITRTNGWHNITFYFPNSSQEKIFFDSVLVDTNIPGNKNVTYITLNNANGVSWWDEFYIITNLTTNFIPNYTLYYLNTTSAKNLTLVYNITKPNNIYDINASLYFNNTLQTGVSKIDYGNYIIFSKEVNANIIVDTNLNYYWQTSISFNEVYFHSISLNLSNLNFNASGIANFYLWHFSLTFKDEITKSPVYNVTIQVISSTNSSNYTTSNGTLIISIATLNDYTFRYSGTNYGLIYPQREYYQKMNYSILETNVDLYLISNASSSIITTLVIDQTNNVVQNANVKVLRYDIATNSYFIVAEKKTDSNGQALFWLQPYGEYYKFIVEYNGVQYYESQAAQITASSYSFQIILTSVAGTTDYIAGQTIANLSVISPNTFRFYFNDLSNTVTKGCIYTYNGATLVDSSCTNGAAGIVTYAVSSSGNATFHANAYLYQGDIYNYVDTKWISLYSPYEDVTGDNMLFWLFLITAALLFMFALNAVLAMVVLPVPLLLFNLFHLIEWQWWYVIGLTISCWIVAYIIEAKQ